MNYAITLQHRGSYINHVNMEVGGTLHQPYFVKGPGSQRPLKGERVKMPKKDLHGLWMTTNLSCRKHWVCLVLKNGISIV